MTEPGTQPRPRPPQHVLVKRGTRVVPLHDTQVGAVVGVAPAYCVFRLDGSEVVQVAPWRDLALADVRPAPLLLPSDIAVQDMLNASAAALSELLALRGAAQLTSAQETACRELLAKLADATS
ncbi:MAG: hypothetical protein KDB14_26145 [Planctomycetales bacterium]|nr:hypothetical protein [Planctomycetales bacterium]